MLKLRDFNYNILYHILLKTSLNRAENILVTPPPPPGVFPTGRGYDLEIYYINFNHIIHLRLLGVLGMFQLKYFKNTRFQPFYSDFKIRSSKNSSKNNIFDILFKLDLKYTKSRRILMRI